MRNVFGVIIMYQIFQIDTNALRPKKALVLRLTRAHWRRFGDLIHSNIVERRLELVIFELDSVHLQKDDEKPVQRYDGTAP